MRCTASLGFAGQPRGCANSASFGNIANFGFRAQMGWSARFLSGGWAKALEAAIQASKFCLRKRNWMNSFASSTFFENFQTPRPRMGGAECVPAILGLGVWKFSKNVELAKEFIQFLFRKENFDAWIVASNAFNHPPLKNLADHPIWARNPKFAMLPKEAEFAHPRGWPAKPSDAAQRIDEAFVLPDMTAKAVNGMPTKRAMDWAQDQVARAIKGQLKVG